MGQQKLVFDGLWRCLCPAVDQQSLSRVLRSPTLLRPCRPQSHVPARHAVKVTTIRRQRYGTVAAHAAATSPSPFSSVAIDQANPAPRQGAGSWEERLLSPTPPTEETLTSASVDTITAALLTIRGDWRFLGQDIDRHARIVQLVTHLVRTRAQPLKPFIYECMMDAMVDPKGSARGVRALFKDMALHGIVPTATLCQSALQALMIHPDYSLRLVVLETMRDLWFPIKTSEKQSTIVGLLRDGQHELAYESFLQLAGEGASIDPWVYNIFILVLGEMGSIEEMLQVLRWREKSIRFSHQHDKAQPNAFDATYPNLLYHALDVCSRSFHLGGTLHAWDRLIRRLGVSPADGIVENVLGTAARHGDSDLAVEALELLSQRGRFQAHHYEATAEAFCANRDVAGALGIFNVMVQNGVVITNDVTRMLYLMVKNNPGMVEESIAVLEKVQQERITPPAAVGAVIEAIAELRGSEATVTLCSGLEEMTSEGRDPTVLRHLICNSATTELRKSLLGDYKESLSEKDDTITTKESYERLILICVEAQEWDLAFQLAGQATEPRAAGAGILGVQHVGWLKPLFYAALAREDGRIWQVVDKLNKSTNEELIQMVRGLLEQSRWRRPDMPGAVADASNTSG